MEFVLFLCVLFVLPGIAYGAWKLFLLFFFPDAYRQTKQHEHERVLSKQATNRQSMGLVGSIFRLFS